MTKIVLATNVAEASVTINDVALVIDCGRVKRMAYDGARAVSSLQDVRISQAEAALTTPYSPLQPLQPLTALTAPYSPLQPLQPLTSPSNTHLSGGGAAAARPCRSRALGTVLPEVGSGLAHPDPDPDSDPNPNLC